MEHFFIIVALVLEPLLYRVYLWEFRARLMKPWLGTTLTADSLSYGRGIKYHQISSLEIHPFFFKNLVI